MKKLQLIGAHGEAYVAAYLASQGSIILERNWRVKDGEIDLIAREGSLLLFVEVKTRTSEKFGHPLEAIDRHKAFRLQKLALTWIALNDKWGSEYRIDCAGVIMRGDLAPEIDYRRGVL
jgi:putative endonuclease